MTILIWSLVVVFSLFTFVILFGAPFLPTHKKRQQDALDLLNLKPGQTMLELGSGDGRILRLAAQRGIRSIGYELNPILVICSLLVTWRYRHLVRVRWANYWHHKLPPTDAIYVFLLQSYMPKLNKKIEQECSKPVKLVSYAFKVPGKKPSRQKRGMYVYDYN